MAKQTRGEAQDAPRKRLPRSLRKHIRLLKSTGNTEQANNLAQEAAKRKGQTGEER